MYFCMCVCVRGCALMLIIIVVALPTFTDHRAIYKRYCHVNSSASPVTLYTHYKLCSLESSVGLHTVPCMQACGQSELDV